MFTDNRYVGAEAHILGVVNAERHVAGANADIGEATAAFFPDLVLSASGGFEYRQTVLTAFQEVEDNLTATRSLAQEAGTQQKAVASAERALQIALNRYQAGAVSYLDVVTAQSIALSNERVAADISRRQMDASVLLVKALGGLWAGLPAGTPVPQGS